jgi:hypothetical protein
MENPTFHPQSAILDRLLATRRAGRPGGRPDRLINDVKERFEIVKSRLLARPPNYTMSIRIASFIF